MNLHEFNKVAGSVAQEFVDAGLEIEHYFPFCIQKMNRMYELPVNHKPSLTVGEPAELRVGKFITTLGEELQEGVEITLLLAYLSKITQMYESDKLSEVNYFNENVMFAELDPELKLSEDRRRHLAKHFSAQTNGLEIDQNLVQFRQEVLVMLADWFGDMVVFIRSEALKFGIPLESVLAVIMGSNFTKLGADGKPIKNEHGKFLKGPNFVPPERHIKSLMFETETLLQEAQEANRQNMMMNVIAHPILLEAHGSTNSVNGSFEAQTYEDDGDYAGDDDDDEDEDYDDVEDDEFDH